jgi:hypothetical protein
VLICKILFDDNLHKWRLSQPLNKDLNDVISTDGCSDNSENVLTMWGSPLSGNYVKFFALLHDFSIYCLLHANALHREHKHRHAKSWVIAWPCTHTKVFKVLSRGLSPVLAHVVAGRPLQLSLTKDIVIPLRLLMLYKFGEHMGRNPRDHTSRIYWLV